jgi:hypothetical protein
MKERIGKDFSGDDYLRIYPHIPADTTDRMATSHGYVEAVHYWPDLTKPEQAWGVNISISYRGPQSKADTDELIAAIARCWGWIAEQEVSNATANR